MENISSAEARRLIEDEGARLVDVRERHEWDEMRIPGAQLVPLSEYEANPALLDATAQKTIFQCAHGSRSMAAASIYEEAHGGAQAFNLEGGIADWAARGNPFEMGPPKIT
ncbi:MAG: rhodanese-like domain-containing protein [Thermoleophilaceae bacterium]|nr:rhodanese-like domain-containing protein [Thermoleophilaceae bacterium]